ncbi:MAG TPA: hypothetical protein VGQ20_15530 [Acidimicrobiales bacterium]|nr:hypothetical protein [Acidimicrobiales bacterium]
MTTIEQHLELPLPIADVYERWTAVFEHRPPVIEAGERLENFSEHAIHWMAKIGGLSREIDPTVLDRWSSGRDVTRLLLELQATATVDFQPLAKDRTCITLRVQTDGPVDPDTQQELEQILATELDKFANSPWPRSSRSMGG